MNTLYTIAVWVCLVIMAVIVLSTIVFWYKVWTYPLEPEVKVDPNILAGQTATVTHTVPIPAEEPYWGFIKVNAGFEMPAVGMHAQLAIDVGETVQIVRVVNGVAQVKRNIQ